MAKRTFEEVKDIGEFADMNSRQHGGMGCLRVKKDGKKIRVVVIPLIMIINTLR